MLHVVEGIVFRRKIPVGEKVHLRLYVADNSTRTEKTIHHVHKIFQDRFAEEYALEVINVIDQPASAEKENILATPTLIKIAPKPVRRIIGDLYMSDAILHGLGFPDH